jgi:cytochrome c oxidase subunit 2
MVVPAGAVVKLIVTSSDVIHSFGVPSFWVKMDAVPGRLNETWFKVDRPGVYYGVSATSCAAPGIGLHADRRRRGEPGAVSAPGSPRRAAPCRGQAKPTSPDATQNSPVSNPATRDRRRKRTPETSPEPDQRLSGNGDSAGDQPEPGRDQPRTVKKI